MEYKHYNDYPMNKWRWKNFKPSEMRCKGDHKLKIDPASMDKLQALRELIDKPMRVTSAYRSPAHNASVGGAKNSQHLKAKAFDIQMAGHDPAQFEAAAREVGFTGFGFYKSSGFIHIDTGPAREWGNRWFPKAMYYNGNPQPDMAEVEYDTPKLNLNPTAPVIAGGVLVAAVVAAFAKLFGG